MKHRASLVLMEQLVMLLVFALAAAVCLQIFAAADRIAQDTVRRDEAAVLAGNAARVLKGSRGDISAAASLPSGNYRLEITEQTPAVPGMGQAEVAVYLGDTRLVAFRTGWQEALP